MIDVKDYGVFYKKDIFKESYTDEENSELLTCFRLAELRYETGNVKYDFIPIYQLLVNKNKMLLAKGSFIKQPKIIMGKSNFGEEISKEEFFNELNSVVKINEDVEI